MDALEYEIRKRLGQKKFDPVNEQKHKRFKFDKSYKSNDDILSLFDDFFYDIESHIILKFYKGSCLMFFEEVTFDFTSLYREVFNFDYSGWGTVEIIKDIILKNSKNYKCIIRDIKIEELGI